MDSLADWIVQNVGLIVIVAVAALSLLSKLKNVTGNPSGERPARPMPSFGGSPGEMRGPVSPRGQENRQASGEGVSMERQEEELRAPRSSGLPVSGPSPFGSRRAETAGRVSEAREASQASPVAPDRDHLAQAVVWAEILGPPRAKKPYGRS